MNRVHILVSLTIIAGPAASIRAQMPLALVQRDLFSGQVCESHRPAFWTSPGPDQESAGETKSVGTAVLYSVLLPGMGELYAGDYSGGKYFTIVEGALWVTLGSVHWYATWLQDDAHQFAAAHAQASIGGKGDQYFIDIGNFRNIYDYNEQALRDRSTNLLYAETPSNYWNWDSPTNQSLYRDKRVSGDQMFNNTRFVVAAIAVNHIVSAINAARLTIAHNKSVEEAQLFDLHAEVLGGLSHPNGIMLTFSRSF